MVTECNEVFLDNGIGFCFRLSQPPSAGTDVMNVAVRNVCVCVCSAGSVQEWTNRGTVD